MAQAHALSVEHAKHEPIRQLVPTQTDRRRSGRQAYQLLRLTFAVVPIVAGLDKFFDILVAWESYLAPAVPRITGLSPSQFMAIVGVVEILVGIGVIIKTKFFAYVVALWFAALVVNLLFLGGYYDVAVRDLALGMAALALARLSQVYERKS